MLRLLSWSGCDKLANPEMSMFVPKQASPSVPTMQTSSPLSKASPNKRKYSPSQGISGSETEIHAAEFAIPTQHEQERYELVSSTGERKDMDLPKHSETPATMEKSFSSSSSQNLQSNQLSKSKKHSLQQTIETQFNLEILLKHNELRLIEQELAKSQIALEQLRRCREIPYPNSHPSIAVSDGTGPALRSSFSMSLPQSPSPWGVTDGPYTRHYAKWLISDPRFDGGELEIHATRSAGKTPTKGRQPRGSLLDSEHASDTPRSQRGVQLPPVSAGYVQPKEKATGPMILKRKSDGVMVKLVCPDCGRYDFGSAQGFINHCRIGHSRSFASHDTAAEACGDPVEYDATGAMIGMQPTTTPSLSHVHPLIRSATLLDPNPALARLYSCDSAKPRHAEPSSTTPVLPGFIASAVTPHLSALIRKKGLAMNLTEAVTDAQVKVELPESDSEDDETEVDTSSVGIQGGRHPRVAGSKVLSSSIEQPSSPLLKSRISFPMTSSNSKTTLNQNIVKTEIGFKGTSSRGPAEKIPFNPSPTTESTQAPSLVDDDEDFEAHSPSTSSESEDNDDMEVDFHVQDDEDHVRESIIPTPEYRPGCAESPAQNTRTHNRKPSAIRRGASHQKEKHVSFANPGPSKKLDVSKSETQQGKKRRRLG